jgi:hypothetical protein
MRGAVTAHDVVELITAVCTGFAAIAASVAAIISARNGRRIEEVHKLTNSLSEKRAEAQHDLGVAQGHAAGLKEGQQHE